MNVSPNPDGCLLWTGSINTTTGYGRFMADGKRTSPQRWLYEQIHGPVPKGMHLDHICHTTDCPEPDPCHHRACVIHVKVVTPRANILRGKGLAARNARKTHCEEGHPFNERRRCPECARTYQREWKAAHRVPHPKVPKPYCPQGHEMTGKNLILWGPKRVWHKCRECGRTAAREHARKKRREAKL